MTCRHTLTDDARHIVITLGEHAEPLPGDHAENCRGCEPCGKRHCAVCCRHLDTGELGTCTTCLSQTRCDLIACVDLVALLPEHALHAARHGHLVAGDPIPGGDAIVMLAPGSEGVSDDGKTNPGDPMPPSYILAWWEEAWRAVLGHPYPVQRNHTRAERILSHAYAYLNAHLGWAAANHPGFQMFATDIAGCRRHLEELLHAGDRPAEGVACFECDATLVRDYRNPKRCACPPRPAGHNHQPDAGCLSCHWDERHQNCDQGGLADPSPTTGWYCPRCWRSYSPGEYQLAVNAAYDEYADYRTLSDVTRLTGVPRGTVQGWASRDHVRRKRDAFSGRVVYNLTDIRARRAEKRDDSE